MKDNFINSMKQVLEMEDQEIVMEDRFREFENWDSLSRLSLIAMLDDEFNVTIEDEIFKNLITVQDLFDEVSKKITNR